MVRDAVKNKPPQIPAQASTGTSSNNKTIHTHLVEEDWGGDGWDAAWGL
jgi:hypothetical protein